MAKNGRKPDAEAKEIALKVETIKAAGTDSKELTEQLIYQVMDSLWCVAGPRNSKIEMVKAAVAALEGIAPQDEVEGLLASQMVATHNAAMDCLRRAILPEQPFQGRDSNLKHAAKLLTLYCRQLATLDKHRSNGQQNITAGPVNVYLDGHVLVGTVEAPAKNGSAKKSLAGKTVLALEHKPGLAMSDVGLNTTSKVKAPAKARIKRGK